MGVFLGDIAGTMTGRAGRSVEVTALRVMSKRLTRIMAFGVCAISCRTALQGTADRVGGKTITSLQESM